jgi:hypothetical protein
MQFARFQVDLKYAEVNNMGRRSRCLHGKSSSRKPVLAQKPSSNNVQDRLADTALP